MKAGESWEQGYPTGYMISEIQRYQVLSHVTVLQAMESWGGGGEGYPTACEISYCCL